MTSSDHSKCHKLIKIKPFQKFLCNENYYMPSFHLILQTEKSVENVEIQGGHFEDNSCPCVLRSFACPWMVNLKRYHCVQQRKKYFQILLRTNCSDLGRNIFQMSWIFFFIYIYTWNRRDKHVPSPKLIARFQHWNLVWWHNLTCSRRSLFLKIF